MKEDKKETVAMEVVETSPVKQSPIEMAKGLIAQQVDPVFVEKMLDLQIKFEENEAKKAFHKAMSLFKVDCPEVKKDLYNKQYKSWYASLGNLVKTISPHMSKHGMSHDWEQEQLENNSIKVIFTVTHELGFSKSNSFTSPPDKSGSKNPIQELKSTVTYLKSITFESGLGLASTDANLSDDGSVLSKGEVDATGAMGNIIIDKTALANLEKKMKDKNVSDDTIIKYFNDNNKDKEIKSLAELSRTQYSVALDMLKNT